MKDRNKLFDVHAPPRFVVSCAIFFFKLNMMNEEWIRLRSDPHARARPILELILKFADLKIRYIGRFFFNAHERKTFASYLLCAVTYVSLPT